MRLFNFQGAVKNCVPTIVMSSGNVACACGNIRAKGQPLPAGSHPNVPSSERPRLSACRSLISIRSRAIIVRDLPQAAVIARSAVCYDIHCHNCNQVFRLFAGRGITVIARLPESAPVPTAAVRLSERSTPSSVTPFIGAAPGASIAASEEAELEAMFSGESNPIVGSYRPHAYLPTELLAGPEAIPRSYYA
jgi:hypothetical protein